MELFYIFIPAFQKNFPPNVQKIFLAVRREYSCPRSNLRSSIKILLFKIDMSYEILEILLRITEVFP